MLRVALGLLMAGPAMADGICDFAAYTRSADLGHIAIHAGPSATSDVVGMAPIEPPESEYAQFGTEFRVLEMRDGWAKVTDVTSFDRTGKGPDGWIDGQQIGLSAQTSKAFAAADADSAVMWASENLWPYADALLDCDGEWALVRFDDIDISATPSVVTGSVTAWVRGVCAAQETTCDGVKGD